MANGNRDKVKEIEAAKRLTVELMYARLAELHPPLPPPPLSMPEMGPEFEAQYLKHHEQWLKIKEEHQKWEEQLPQIRERRIALEARWEKLKAKLDGKL